MGHQPLRVPQHRPGDAEGPHAHDGHHQHEDRRVGTGAGDQPRGGGRERHPGGRGQHAEHRGERARTTPRGRRHVLRLGRRGSGDGCAPRPGRRRRQCRRRGGRERGRARPPGRRGQHRRPVRHDHDEGSRGQGAHHVEQDLLGGVVEVGGGLVEQHDRPVGEEHPGQSPAGRAVRRTGRRRPHRGGGPARRGARPRPRSARARRGRATAARRSRRERRGAGRRGPCPAASHGRWGSQATWRRHQSGSTSTRSTPPTSTCPSYAASSPRRVCSRVDLPHPLGSGDSDQSAVGEVQDERAGQRPRGAGVAGGEVDECQTGRRGTVVAGGPGLEGRQRLRGLREGGRALGGGVELGADPAQRPVRLGGQEQHDQGRLEARSRPPRAAGRRTRRPAPRTGSRPARARWRRRRRRAGSPRWRGGSAR